MTNPQAGSLRTVIEVEFTNDEGDPLDISSASVKIIKVRPRGGDTVEHDGIFTTDGTDGLLKFETAEPEDLPPGVLDIQGYVEMIEWSGHTEKGTIKVLSNL